MNRADRNKLVVENLPLVGYLVSETCAKATHLSRDDMASAGSLALITSADSYNPDLGVPFGAFARRRILGAIADELRSGDWATRSARRRMKETLAVQEALTGALRRTPSVEEIAAALGVERSVVAEALTDLARSVSVLDETTAEVVMTDLASPEGTLLASERTRFVCEAVAALPEKMRYIVEQVHFEGRSVKELAAELGATHSAVSQQRAEAIRLLRDALHTQYSDEPAHDYVPQARVTTARRTAYLATLAEAPLGGITRTVRAVEPALSPVTS